MFASQFICHAMNQPADLSAAPVPTSPLGAVPRRPRFVAAGLCLAALALGACDKKPPTTPPKPVVEASVALHGSTTAGAADPSLPSADSVFSPKNEAPKSDPAAGRSNNATSPAQEPVSMPLPGQNNDHSAPLPATARASRV
jgi:hypothetical protein